MTYTFNDFKQSAIGAFIALILLFAVRSGEPYFFDWRKGFALTVIIIWIYYSGYRMKDKLEHFIINLLVSFGVSALMANTFGLIEINQIFTKEVLGSLVMVGVWIGFLSGMLHDRYNFYNPMDRYYVR